MPTADLHPELRRMARFIPRQLVTPSTLPLWQRLTRLQGRRVPKGVEVLTLTNGVGVRLYRPSGVDGHGPGPLWIHGGGYVLGSAAQDDRLCRRFADELGATVASVQYRLAPQHPYPASLEDCYSALKWLAALPAVDPARVAIGGASAGGGLAAALALLARDRGEVPVAAQLLVYPMLDDRTVGRDFDHPGHRLWTHTENGSAGRPIWATPTRPAVAPDRHLDPPRDRGRCPDNPSGLPTASTSWPTRRSSARPIATGAGTAPRAFSTARSDSTSRPTTSTVTALPLPSPH